MSLKMQSDHGNNKRQKLDQLNGMNGMFYNDRSHELDSEAHEEDITGFNRMLRMDRQNSLMKINNEELKQLDDCFLERQE